MVEVPSSVSSPALDRYRWARRTFPDMQVDSLESFEQLDAVHRSIARAGEETHRFRLASGQLIRCIELTSQPAITHLGIDPACVKEAHDEVVAHMADAERRGARSLARLFGMDGTRDEQGRLRICPPGSIPLWAPPLRTFLGFKNLAELRSYYPNFADVGPGSSLFAGLGFQRYHVFAGLNNVANLGQLIDMNPWNPTIQSDGMAIGQIWSQRGTGAEKQSVETGWQVVEKIYKDRKTHFFIYFTTHNYDPAYPEGYNANQYFTQVNPAAILGGVIPVSKTGEDTQLSIETFGTWLRGSGSKRGWWILLMGEPIGYYPINLFADTGLANGSANVVFGGEVVNNEDTSPSTWMGSGVLPQQSADPIATNFGKCAFMKRARYVDTNNEVQTIGVLGTKVGPNPAAYTLIVAPNEDPSWTPGFFFGGPGPSPGGS